MLLSSGEIRLPVSSSSPAFPGAWPQSPRHSDRRQVWLLLSPAGPAVTAPRHDHQPPKAQMDHVLPSAFCDHPFAQGLELMGTPQKSFIFTVLGPRWLTARPRTLPVMETHWAAPPGHGRGHAGRRGSALPVARYRWARVLSGFPEGKHFGWLIKSY